MARNRTSPARFELAQTEKLRFRMEVRADTPDSAGVGRLLCVTDRRVVLCRLPVAVHRTTELVMVAGFLVVAVIWPVGSFAAAVAAMSVIAGLAVARARLRRPRIAAERPTWSLSGVVWRDGAMGLGFTDGRVWMLRPARVLTLFTLVDGRKALRRAFSDLRGLLGFLDHPPLPVRPWRNP